jgi:Holliday junction resolvase RusA-like endonuclease
MSTLSVTVPGTAVPQGSMRLVHGGSRMTHSNKNLNAWRATVARHTIAEIQQTERRFGRTFPLTGPVNLIVVFNFPRPKHHYRQGKFANLLRDVAPRYMQTGPDLDKLVRAIGDALVAACAIVDDKQINVIHAGKHWADGEPQTTIEIWSV